MKLIKYILPFLFILNGCQSLKKIEYYENGKIKSVEEREGFPNFSENKNFNLKR